MEDHAVRAVEASLDMRQAIQELNDELEPADRVQFRVGMNSGRVVAGDIGSVRRSDYSVLGSAVNLASRVENSVAEAGQIVVTDITYEMVKDRFVTRFITEAQPKGITRKVKCYEILGRK
jgi:adenylate cyclase